MARSRCSVLKQLTSRWSTSLCISERFICILTPKIHETTTTIFLWNKAYFHLTLQVSLKFLLRWGDYKNCRNYTVQLYIHGSANTLLAYNKWPLLKTLLPPRYGSRCWDPAEIPHIPYLTLRGGVLLLPRHPDQQILLALSRIPPHEEKVLSQRKVLRINPFETKCKITYVFFHYLEFCYCSTTTRSYAWNMPLHIHHMGNDGTFSCLWGKLLLCFWKYSISLAITKRSEDNGNTKCCVCACFRLQKQSR